MLWQFSHYLASRDSLVPRWVEGERWYLVANPISICIDNFFERVKIISRYKRQVNQSKFLKIALFKFSVVSFTVCFQVLSI